MQTRLPSPRSVTDELHSRIARQGRITFAEFMSLALYWPHGGYYATRIAFGPGGDFYTAPLTHPIFGALLARQLLQMWRNMGSPSPFWVIEPGAGSGRLAADITTHAQGLSRPFANGLRYVAVDIRPGNARGGFSWVRSSGIPFRGIRGVVLANELLDALPVHRVVVQDRQLQEIYITAKPTTQATVGASRIGIPQAEFAEEIGPLSTPRLAQRLAGLAVSLPEGHRTEVCLAFDDLLPDVANALEAGYLLLIDYGHEAADYYSAERHRGTLRCYYQHTLSGDPYVRVGRQDIGAHVEFTSVRRAAEAAGMATVGLTTQADFLQRLGLDSDAADLHRTASAPIAAANLRAVQTLTAPDAMGAFKVLAMRKCVPDTPLAGFGGPTEGLPQAGAPLATPAHMPVGPAGAPAGLPTWNDLLQ